MFRLSARDRAVVESVDLCRLATISESGWPHVVPVGYVYAGGAFYVPTSPNTRKVVNLRICPRATIVIDDEVKEHGVMLECSARILRGGRAERWARVMRESKGWEVDGTMIIKLTPRSAVSWRLK